MNYFTLGFKRMIPITASSIPFGLVMGSVAAEAKLSLSQSVFMNLLVFAGASQLAAVDLISRHTPIFVVVATGLIINLRFILYSAALAPIVQKSGFWAKLGGAFFLTDQGYALMSAHEDYFESTSDALQFYFGTVLCMFINWHSSVLAGYLFGNFAPASLSLDYGIALGFIVLLLPTLKNRQYVVVAFFSFFLSLLLKPLPYNLGLIVSALLGIALAAFLTRRKEKR